MELHLLRQFCNKIQPLEEEEWTAFAAVWQPLECRRKEVLTRPGETEKYLYFVMDGVQRIYFQGETKEATIIFSYPHSFSGVADSFLTRLPSVFYFETLTASSFLKASYQPLQKLMEQYPAIMSLVLKATSFALKGVLERLAEVQVAGAEEKFRQLLKRSPQVLNMIPHKYLASYLGIDPATFSKLLGTVKI